jgi:hypothetical protein
MDRTFAIGILCAAAITSGGCEARKSSNPLSPTVAGPIPGIDITTPKILEPRNGDRIAVDKQPLTLLIENASTTGVRPLWYDFDIATDAGFTTRIFTREKVTPGEGGRTSLRLPDALATGRTYYWRARAADGANAGSFISASFDVYTPIVIREPGLVAPQANSTVTTLRPELRVTNAPRSGPVGAITYLFEIASDSSFANRVAAVTTAESGGQTAITVTANLKYNTVYYWHVRAFDPTTNGPWSEIRAFVTPEEAAAPPPTGSVPVGPIAGDAFNLGAAVVHSSPAGVGSWPVTTSITSLSFRTDGVAVEFSKKSGPGRWPDVVPPGWSGPLQYTLWIAMNLGGVWHTCGPMEYWYGLAAQGGDVTINNQIAVNWTYYCGPMARQPQPGEQVGFFVTAGDQRMKDVYSVHERSNVVVVPFPASAGLTFSF